jgi:hypothetical protein
VLKDAENVSRVHYSAGAEGGGAAFYMLVLLFVYTYVCFLRCVLRGALCICFRMSD